MSGSKHFDRIAVVATAITLVITIAFMNGAVLGLEATQHTIGYENRLFDQTKVHTLDITMENWDDFIDNATSEEYYNANVVIDGEAYKNVGIRAKGNTSLSTVATLDSERYSFKIEFDHYDKTKTYHGLDKLSLNNLIQDSTMMKDYLTYTMMQEFGVDSSLCSYVYITVNGEDWGLYLAVEGVEDAFLERNYGSDSGELYKPDSMSGGDGPEAGGDFDMGDFDIDSMFDGEMPNMPNADTEAAPEGFDPTSISGGEMPSIPNGDTEAAPEGFDPTSMSGSEMPNMPTGDTDTTQEEFDFSGNMENFDPSSMFGGDDNAGFPGGGFDMGSSDVKLQYIDDDPDSYENIWDNAKTDITEADQTRLIESLQKLSNNEDITSIVDVDQVIRYFVVHNYVCNGDSYTGSMVHNYYLYEKDGQLAMIPWDYNLAFGTFQGSNANSTINTPIDSPVDNGSGEDRPMWNWIVANEEYTQQYHQYFESFLNTVDIEGIIDHAYNLIQDYVQKDPTAFYSYEEFQLGVETLRQFCNLRSESISMQLQNNETTDTMNYVDASAITLSDMGSMGGGMGGGDMPDMGNIPNPFDNTSSTDETSDSNDGFSGEMPDGFDPSNMQGGFGGGFPGQAPQNDEDDENAEETSEVTGDTVDRDSNRHNGGNMPDGDFSFDFPGTGADSPESDLAPWLWIAASVVILGMGLIVAKKFKV